MDSTAIQNQWITDVMAKMGTKDRSQVDASYTSFEASDTFISALMPWKGEPYNFGNASLFSYSSHRDKYPATNMGDIRAKGFTHGHRSIVGNLGFRILNSKLIQTICEEFAQTVGMTERARLDQLPPFTLLVVKYNIQGAYKCLVLEGVCFQDDGRTMQIDDTTLSWVTSFHAISIAETGKGANAEGSLTASTQIQKETEAPTDNQKTKTDEKVIAKIPDVTQVINPNSYYPTLSFPHHYHSKSYDLEGALDYIGTNPKLYQYTPYNSSGIVLIQGTYKGVTYPPFSYNVPETLGTVSGYVLGLLPDIEFNQNWTNGVGIVRDYSYAYSTCKDLLPAIDLDRDFDFSFNPLTKSFASRYRADMVMAFILDEYLRNPSGALQLMGDWCYMPSTSMTGTYYSYDIEGETLYSPSLPYSSTRTGYFCTVPYSGQLRGNKMTSQESDFVKHNKFGNPFLFPFSELEHEIGVFNFGAECGYGYSFAEGNLAEEIVRIALESGKDATYLYEKYKAGSISLEQLFNGCKVDPKSTRGTYMTLTGRREITDFCYAAFWVMVQSAKLAGYEIPFEEDVFKKVPTTESIDKLRAILARNLTSESLMILGLNAVTDDYVRI